MVSILKFWLLFCALSLAHATRQPGLYDGQFKVAMEVELSPRYLKNLVHVFDWDLIEREHLWRVESQPLRKGLETGSRIPLSKRNKDFLAALAIEIAPDRYDGPDNIPPLRTDLPPDLLAIMKNLEWHWDSDRLEFRNRNPDTDFKTYLDRLWNFAALAGIEKPLKQPTNKRLAKVSYHLNISRTDDRPLENYLTHFNRLLLMRLINTNSADEFFDGSRTSQYDENVSHRGLVRLKGSVYEVRAHTLPPEEELLEQARFLSLSEKSAIQEIAQETQSLLSPANYKKLLELSPDTAPQLIAGSSSLLQSSQIRVDLTNPLLQSAIEQHVLKSAPLAEIHYADASSQARRFPEETPGLKQYRNFLSGLRHKVDLLTGQFHNYRSQNYSSRHSPSPPHRSTPTISQASRLKRQVPYEDPESPPPRTPPSTRSCVDWFLDFFR